MDVGGPSRGVPTAAVSVGTAGVTPATDGSTAAAVVVAVAAAAVAIVAIFSINRVALVTCCFITLPPSQPSPAGDAVALMVSTCIPHGRAGRGSAQFTNCQHKEKKKKERYIGKGAHLFLPPPSSSFLPCAERLAVIQHRKCP